MLVRTSTNRLNRRTFLGKSAAVMAMFLRRRTSAVVPPGPVPFGYKINWITVRCERVDTVVTSLSLRSSRPANWAEGIDVAYRYKEVFVAPPVQGWIAIIGYGKGDFESRDSVACARRRVESASLHFHTACGFATQRVVGYHHWMRAEEGRMSRCFAFIGERGEVLCNLGAVTAAERTLSFGELPPEQWQPNEEDVMKVAAGWSYDPTKLTPSSAASQIGAVATWE